MDKEKTDAHGAARCENGTQRDTIIVFFVRSLYRTLDVFNIAHHPPAHPSSLVCKLWKKFAARRNLIVGL